MSATIAEEVPTKAGGPAETAVAPRWWDRLRERYANADAHTFILHGAVDDYVAGRTRLPQWLDLALEKLTGIVVHYDVAGGVRFLTPAMGELAALMRPGAGKPAAGGDAMLAALGSLGAVVALDRDVIDPELGWRVAFVIGGVIGLAVLFLRQFIPESPRWLMTHGYPEEAARVVAALETRVEREMGTPLPPLPSETLRLRRHHGDWFFPSLKVMFRDYRERTILGAVLMSAQAFCYNAVLFTYALMLTKFYQIPAGHVGWYMLPFALGNFAGPVVLGKLFDVIGRKTMITATYAISGVLMAVVGFAFNAGWLDATQQTIGWTVIFFFASAAASSAYLTVGETFPLEVRAIAISIFYALGTGIGGIAGPAVFGALIASGEKTDLLWGYLMAAAFMLIAAGTEWRLGVEAAGRSLEDVAPPLSAA